PPASAWGGGYLGRLRARKWQPLWPPPRQLSRSASASGRSPSWRWIAFYSEPLCCSGSANNGACRTSQASHISGTVQAVIIPRSSASIVLISSPLLHKAADDSNAIGTE